MTISDAQFTAWLKDQSSVRCVLVEADVKLAGGSVVTRYLSNKTYVTVEGETPPSTIYSPRIAGGIKFTRSLSLDGQASLSFGDIELLNTDGALDTWLDDYWVNRQIRVYIGDVTWARADFRIVFTGVMTGVDSRKRDRINIKLSDILQRLNNPVTEVKIGGTGNFADSLYPLCFGECHNITPVLMDSTTNEYMVHNGAIEGIIEVRDNGIPVSYSSTPATGRFRLSAAPAGTITCSVQGAKLPSNNLLTDISVASPGWTPTRLLSSPTTAVGVPFQGAVVKALIPTNVSGQHFTDFDAVLTAGATTTMTFYVKPAVGTKIDLMAMGVEATEQITMTCSFSTGKFNVSLNAASTTNGGTYSNANFFSVGGGWYGVTLTANVGSVSATRRFRIRVFDGAGAISFTGDNVTPYAYVSAPSMGLGYWNLSPALTAEAVGGTAYRNNIVDIIRYIATNYGNATQRLTDLDFDWGSMVQFGMSNMQPVGVFLSDRQNVLDVCNQLATSVGGRLYVTAAGKVGAVELSLPQVGPGTLVGSSDIVDRSLEIKQLAPVTASVKLGYCKNWTVQTGLTTGIVSEHAALYAEEWLTQTATDSAAAANYNLYTDPTMIETYLLTAFDALTEANRRLAMFSTQRKVIKYTGYYHLLFETLGGPQTLTHSRFGLGSGKVGQIISISVDLLSPHVDFEVLV